MERIRIPGKEEDRKGGKEGNGETDWRVLPRTRGKETATDTNAWRGARVENKGQRGNREYSGVTRWKWSYVKNESNDQKREKGGKKDKSGDINDGRDILEEELRGVIATGKHKHENNWRKLIKGVEPEH